MVFSLVIFLYIYYAFLVICASLSLAGVYHMLRYGFKNITTIVTTFIFLAMAFMILSVSFGFINSIDWNVEIAIFSNLFTNKLDI